MLYAALVWTASTRAADEEVLMTDGPFVDSKEQIVGFSLFDCDDLGDVIS